MNIYDVIIIGAGPAGMMAGIIASENKKSVLIVEKNDQLGRKILATGNGRCNITNVNVAASNFYGAEPSFTTSVLDRFDNKETMRFFAKLGLMLKTEDRGRVFPRTNQASSVVEVLRSKLLENGVEIALNSEVKNISKENSIWNIQLTDGKVFNSHKMIIATGGKASFVFGSSGDGLFWAKKLGHTISPIYASLVPIETVENWPSSISGIKIEAKVSVLLNGKTISNRFGDLLFTHFGLSGPAIMSQSRTIASSIENGKVVVSIDQFPDKDEKELKEIIQNVFQTNGKKTVRNCLVGFMPQRLIDVVISLSQIKGEMKAAEISKNDCEKLIQTMKNLSLNVSKVRPLKEAQVTAGGVLSTEINETTLESKIISNLYFAGEVVDVDGDSGGFNLQWAWSSGYVAGNLK